MSYTGLILPHHKPRITHKTIFAGFAFFVGLYIVGAISMMILSVQKSNSQLAQKISAMSAKATNVGAPIVTPSAGNKASNFEPIDKADAVELIETISALAVVPVDESPTLALVVNTDKLPEELFFRNVEQGDQLLVYENAGLAIIYRPSIKKLVALGNINTGKTGQTKGAKTTASSSVPTNQASSSTASKKLMLPAKVAIYYVKETPELKKDTVAQIRSALPDAQIISESPLKSGISYDKTTIIDLKGGQDELIARIAGVVGGSPGTEAQGEQLPSDADILVIVAEKPIESTP